MRVDPPDDAVVLAGDPDRAFADRDALGRRTHVDRRDDVVGLGVDLRDRVVLGVGHPDGALPHGDLERDRPEGDRRDDLAALRVDAVQRGVPSRSELGAHDPDRPLAGGDADRLGADTHSGLDRCRGRFLGRARRGLGGWRGRGPGLARARGRPGLRIGAGARAERERARGDERRQPEGPPAHRHEVRPWRLRGTYPVPGGREHHQRPGDPPPILGRHGRTRPGTGLVQGARRPGRRAALRRARAAPARDGRDPHRQPRADRRRPGRRQDHARADPGRR